MFSRTPPHSSQVGRTLALASKRLAGEQQSQKIRAKLFLRDRSRSATRSASCCRPRRPAASSAVRATSPRRPEHDRSPRNGRRPLFLDPLRRGDKSFTLSLLARQLVTPTHSFGPFADASFGGFLISPASFHFAKEAFTLQPFLEHLQGLIDIVVHDEDTQNCSDLKVAATPRPQCVRLFERSSVIARENLVLQMRTDFPLAQLSSG
ncbi:hypothetical protein MCBRY_002990 [Methylocystis bryophila]